MDENEWGNPELMSLAERLRQYRAVSIAQLIRIDPKLGKFYSFEGNGEAQDDDVQGSGALSSLGVPSTSRILAKGNQGTKNAAVLVPLFRGSHGELRVWLTKRASKLSSHSGEVALPGGKRDKDDINDSATALREAEEEIGLPQSVVKVVTHLEPFLSKNLLTVTPVVGILPHGHNFEPIPNSGEVEVVFNAPLAMFLQEQDHSFQDTEWLGMPYRIHSFEYKHDLQSYRIWGLTAAILVRTASVVYEKNPDFREFHPEAPNYPKIVADLAHRDLLSVQ